jgi:hypothetical protein
MDCKRRGAVLYLQQKQCTAAVSIRDSGHREMRPEVQAAMCTVSTKCNLVSMFFFEVEQKRFFLPPCSSSSSIPLEKLIQTILTIHRLVMQLKSPLLRLSIRQNFVSFIIIITIIIIIIIGISLMQGIYTYIPETNHIPRKN